MSGREPVPLPKFGCGCDGDKYGTHLTTCGPAHEYVDNLVMGIGQSYRVPNWRYPVELNMTADVTVEVDFERWLGEPHRLKEYVRWHHDGDEYGEEKPIAYISWLASEGLDLHIPGHKRSAMESKIEITDWDDYRGRSWTSADTLALHQKLGIADADGNPCEPVSVPDTIEDVERQLPFKPPPAPQPTPEAQLLADLRATVVDQAGLEMLLNTWTHNAAVTAAHTVNAEGVAAQINFIIKNYGGLAEARQHLPIGGT